MAITQEYQDNSNRVRFRMFGLLQVENKYGTVEENPVRPGVSWLLLKYMLFNYGRNISEEEMTDVACANMPSIQTDDSANRVRRRRLRDALKPLHLDDIHHGLVQFELGMYVLNPDYVMELDVDRFNAIIGELLARPMDDPDAMQLCFEALEIYRGDFLKGTYEAEWLKPYQEHYRKLFEFLAQNTFQRIQISGDKQALSLLCKRTACIVPQWEEFHRPLSHYLIEQKEGELLLRYVYLLSQSRPSWINDID